MTTSHNHRLSLLINPKTTASQSFQLISCFLISLWNRNVGTWGYQPFFWLWTTIVNCTKEMGLNLGQSWADGRTGHNLKKKPFIQKRKRKRKLVLRHTKAASSLAHRDSPMRTWTSTKASGATWVPGFVGGRFLTWKRSFSQSRFPVLRFLSLRASVECS